METTSDVLRELTVKLKELDSVIADSSNKLESVKDDRSKISGRLEDLRQNRIETVAVFQSSSSSEYERRFTKLEELCATILKDQPFRLENCDARERDLRSALDSQLESLNKDINGLRETVVRAMSSYNAAFPIDTEAVDASLQSVHEYEKMLADLKSDDLPRFKLRFKALLNENTIREIAQFNSQLVKERDEITSRIDQINGLIEEN